MVQNRCKKKKKTHYPAASKLVSRVLALSDDKRQHSISSSNSAKVKLCRKIKFKLQPVVFKNRTDI